MRHSIADLGAPEQGERSIPAGSQRRIQDLRGGPGAKNPGVHAVENAAARGHERQSVQTLRAVKQLPIDSQHHALIEIQSAASDFLDQRAAVARVQQFDAAKRVPQSQQRHVAAAEWALTVIYYGRFQKFRIQRRHGVAMASL